MTADARILAGGQDIKLFTEPSTSINLINHRAKRHFWNIPLTGTFINDERVHIYPLFHGWPQNLALLDTASPWYVLYFRFTLLFPCFPFSIH